MTVSSIKRLAVAAGAALLLTACDSGPVQVADGGTMPEPECEGSDACLELQICCRLTLVNPVFFQSCNQVVLSEDCVECERLLAGYVQCQVPEPDGGVGDGGAEDGG